MNDKQGMSRDMVTVDAIQVAAVTLEKAARFYEASREKQAMVASMIPEVTAALVANGRIDPEDKAECASALADPVKALQLLKFAAEHRLSSESSLPTRLVDVNGNASVAIKQASSRNVVLGARGDFGEAGVNFDRDLGIIG